MLSGVSSPKEGDKALLTAEQTETNILQQRLSSIAFKMYTAVLYLCFASGVVYSVFTIIDLAREGLRNTDTAEGADLDMTSLVIAFMSISQAWTFYTGIQARQKLDPETQTKFYSYLTLLTQFYILMGSFFLISIFCFRFLGNRLVEVEKVELYYIFSHTALFLLAFFRARELDRSLKDLHGSRRV
jgi:hypothetical protein